jgi:hypothetical protein
LAAVVRPTPIVKTVWVRVMPTTPRPSTGRMSVLLSLVPGSAKREITNSKSPARVKRAAAKSTGGTSATTSLTAVKFVPKKKTVRSRDASTSAGLRRPPTSFVAVTGEG